MRDLFGEQFRKNKGNGFKNHPKPRMIRMNRITAH